MNERTINSTTYPMLFQMLDADGHVEHNTGLTPAVTLSKNGGAFGAALGAVTEIGHGWYALAANATDRNTLGDLTLHADAAEDHSADHTFAIVAHNPFEAIWAIQLSLVNITNCIGAFTGSGVNTVLGFFKALLSKSATLPTDVGGTFDPATDSTEAISEIFGNSGSFPVVITSGWTETRARALLHEMETTDAKQLTIDANYQSAVVGAILEYSRVKPYVNRTRYQLNRGAFSKAAVTYIANDVVLDGTAFYQCILGYTTSGASGLPSADATHWTLLANGEWEFALPIDWQTDYSQMIKIEYPGDRQEPDYLDLADYLVLDGYWRLRNESASADDTAYLTYTALHTEDTVPAGNREGLAKLAAANVCFEMAARFAKTEAPRVQADAVNYRTKSDEWRSLGKDFRKMAYELLGVDVSATGDIAQAAAGQTAVWEFTTP
jgi:hypothetical protein